MIKAIALDDEPLALEILTMYCEDIPEITIEKTFTNQIEAIKHLNTHDVDLLFLDIEMPEFNGITLYKSLKKETKVIFTTAYSQYAVEGFNVNAIDYLLKPITKERFVQATTKAIQLIKPETNNKSTNTHLSIRADFKLHQIPLSDILFLQALDDYVQVFLVDGKKIVTRSTLKNILQKLPNQQFIKIHRSYIIAINKVTSYYKQTVKIKDFTIPVSDSFRKKLSEILEE